MALVGDFGEFGESTPSTILCCMCGTPIPANPANMCVNCVRTQVDITEGIPKQDHVQWCKACDRYLNPPNAWVPAELESKELLSLCLKRVKGLNKVKLVDAAFIWTEPHSRRIKVKLTIQKEVFNGTILQQSFVVEFVVNNQQCDECQRVEAKDTWTAVVQLRQRVGHKRTILFLEQLILKHGAHQNTINIKEQPDGLDFFYHHRGHAQTFVQFLQSVVPMRAKQSDKLVSHDSKSNIYNYKYTYSCEIVPICRDDIMCVPHKTAQQLGSMAPFVICTKITNQVQLMDPFTLQTADLAPAVFWSKPFRTLWSAGQLVSYTILDITPVHPSEVGGQPTTHGKYQLADVEVARTADLGVNDIIFFGRTHLGAWLRPGDSALGYDLTSQNFSDADVEPLIQARRELPEFVLIRKAYPERRKRSRARHWQLRSLAKTAADPTETERAAARQEARRVTQHDDEEDFKQMLEEDPEMRSQVALFATADAARIKALNDQSQYPDEEADFPDIELTELLTELTIEDTKQGGEQQSQQDGSLFASSYAANEAGEVALSVDEARALLVTTQQQLEEVDGRLGELSNLAAQQGLTPEIQQQHAALEEQRAVLHNQGEQLIHLLASVS